MVGEDPAVRVEDDARADALGRAVSRVVGVDARRSTVIRTTAGPTLAAASMMADDSSMVDRLGRRGRSPVRNAGRPRSPPAGRARRSRRCARNVPPEARTAAPDGRHEDDREAAAPRASAAAGVAATGWRAGSNQRPGGRPARVLVRAGAASRRRLGRRRVGGGRRVGPVEALAAAADCSRPGDGAAAAHRAAARWRARWSWRWGRRRRGLQTGVARLGRRRPSRWPGCRVGSRERTSRSGLALGQLAGVGDRREVVGIGGGSRSWERGRPVSGRRSVCRIVQVAVVPDSGSGARPVKIPPPSRRSRGWLAAGVRHGARRSAADAMVGRDLGSGGPSVRRGSRGRRDR